jgi:hypothetical protein
MQSLFSIGIKKNNLVIENGTRTMGFKFPCTELGEVIKGPDGISKIIYELHKIVWYDEILLYEVANNIRMYSRNKKINWIKTFTLMELALLDGNMATGLLPNVTVLTTQSIEDMESFRDHFKEAKRVAICKLKDWEIISCFEKE